MNIFILSNERLLNMHRKAFKTNNNYWNVFKITISAFGDTGTTKSVFADRFASMES